MIHFECDHPGCIKQSPASIQESHARLLARRINWWLTPDAELCPEHRPPNALISEYQLSSTWEFLAQVIQMVADGGLKPEEVARALNYELVSDRSQTRGALILIAEEMKKQKPLQSDEVLSAYDEDDDIGINGGSVE